MTLVNVGDSPVSHHSSLSFPKPLVPGPGMEQTNEYLLEAALQETQIGQAQWLAGGWSEPQDSAVTVELWAACPPCSGGYSPAMCPAAQP